MPSTFLSIDLDFWCIQAFNHSISDGVDFIKKCIEIKVPVSFHSEHQSILKHTDKYDCTNLINVDFHDDIIGFTDLKDYHDFMRRGPEDYNWVNFVKWRKGSNYLWLHPQVNIMSGCCDLERNLYDGKKRSGWNNISYDWMTNHSQLMNTIPWLDVVGVGIVVSPSYLDNYRFAVAIARLMRQNRFSMDLVAGEDFDEALCNLDSIYADVDMAA